ncbi:hypothetical protein V7654_01720 [Bacillus sp. JJ1609]|uniref:hypothetical protein n=1 Tax=Bacillus sp. JJ1609 TaxID=3122977 RepID=UPI002FFDB7E1
MKKPFKIAIVSIILLLAGGAGAGYYFLNVKEFEVADKKVEKITENDYQVDLPDLDGNGAGEAVTNTDVADGDDAADMENGNGSDASAGVGTLAGTKQDGTASQTGTNSDPVVASNNGSTSDVVSENKADKSESSKPSAGDTAKGSTDGKKDSDASRDGNADAPVITAEAIKSAYRPSFESLQAQANGKIDALVNTAVSEYQMKKQNGESVSITYFYRKYSSAGNELERNTDETFHYIYDSLVEDLEDRGFSEFEANEFKTQYESAKKARESALIEKAKNAL